MDIVLSIYPTYNKLIKEGIKNFEFRPFELTSETGEINMWVYETKPTMAIKYLMVVRNPVSVLNESSVYGLGNDKFNEIISTGRVGYEIIKLYELVNKVPLSKMKLLGLCAPQNFLYLKNKPSLLKELKQSPLIQIL